MTVRELVTLLTSLCNEDGAGGCEVRLCMGDTDTEVGGVRKEPLVNGSSSVFLYGKDI